MALTNEQREKLAQAFRPHSPIEDPQSFFGREAELDSVKDGIFQPGQQVIVYGERGAGKTSLVNVATAGIKRLQVFCEKDVTFQVLAKHIVLEYQKLNPGGITYDAYEDKIKVSGATLPLGALDGNSLKRILPTDEDLCIILDEVDRIDDANVLSGLAELAKNLSTYQQRITLIFIGVADTVKDLLKGHQSNFRNLRDVQLGRMDETAARKIIQRGEGILSLSFDASVVTKIIELSDRLPYYVHLLATSSAKSALSVNATVVKDEHLQLGAQDAALAADEVLRTAYDHAILSVKATHIYRYVLWGLASLGGESRSVGAITAEANKFSAAEDGKAVSVQSTGQAIKALMEEKKGAILQSKSAKFYSFSHPLMTGYIRLVVAGK